MSPYIKEKDMGKIITLITGAERGMGLVTAKALGQKGQHIIIGAYNMDLGQQALAELIDVGVEAELYKCDVTNRDDINALVAAIDDKYGYLNILINNAGIAGPMTSPSQTSEEDLRKTMETNFFGAAAMVQAFLPLLKKAEFGKIINITSDLGSLTLASDPTNPLYNFNSFAYSASKAATNFITVAFAKELAGTNITVNSVNPGMTATDLINKKAFEENGAKTPEQGAARAIELASSDDNTLTGTFTQDTGPLPW